MMLDLKFGVGRTCGLGDNVREKEKELLNGIQFGISGVENGFDSRPDL
jgi:hypothetical protein